MGFEVMVGRSEAREQSRVHPLILNTSLLRSRLIGSAEVFMSRADDDGDNLLNFHEFANYMLEHEHNLKLVFKTIDVDKDGAITLHEIQVRDFGRLYSRSSHRDSSRKYSA